MCVCVCVCVCACVSARTPIAIPPLAAPPVYIVESVIEACEEETGGVVEYLCVHDVALLY